MTRSARAVPVANAVVVVALVSLLAALALVVKPPSPPGIAEFAPRAAKPITKAPLAQSAHAGGEPGGCAARQSCLPTPTPHPTSSVRGVGDPHLSAPSALQCYSWPDGSVTQTFDPQSPACVASWPGAEQGNGGATSAGVTKTDVTYVVAHFPESAKALARFFNSHFEMYGRRIRVVEGPDNAYSQVRSVQGQRALAAQIAEQGAFAASTPDMSGYSDLPSYTTFIDAAAARHVITIDGTPYYAQTSQAQRNAPYQWSYAPYLDTVLSNLAELTCTELAGRPATHAGPALSRTTRKFAVLVAKDPNGLPPPDLGSLKDGLAECNTTAEVHEFADESTDPSANAQLFLQLEREGVTTVFLVAYGGQNTYMTNPPNSGYQPEWVVAGLQGQTDPAYWSGGSRQPQQMQHLFGLDPESKPLPPGVRPEALAASEVGASNWDANTYHQMLLLASGIQGAGPDLTPRTFAEGLWRTRFPNPGAAAAPSYQASVGVREHTFAFLDDLALIWWDPTNQDPSKTYTGPGGGPGGFCYVGRGRRWSLGSWPRSDPGLFVRAKGC